MLAGKIFATDVEYQPEVQCMFLHKGKEKWSLL